MEAEGSRFVDHHGLPFSRSSTGGWRSANFIIGVEMAERFAYYGIASNLITYMTGPMGSSVAAAAENVNAWSGTSMMLPVLGGLLADSWLGRYRTILVASALYLLGLGMLTLSAAMPSFHTSTCDGCKPTAFPTFFFFLAVYLVAIAQGCHKPNAQAFAADQFDESDPGKSTFFNWWYWGMSLGATAAIVIVNYVEDNVSWGIGFGIPFAAMAVAVALFLLGRRTYRYYVATTSKSPLVRIADGAGALCRRVRASCSKEKGKRSRPADGSEMDMGINQHSRSGDSKNSSKRLLKVLPIWATCLIYAVCFAQTTTVFTKQGSTMERSIGGKDGHLKVPPATLQIFISCTIILFLPLYDRVLVPLARRLTGLHSGITTLQRIGVGQLLAIASIVSAAVVEMQRLKVVQDRGLSGLPKAVVPMKVWWLVPQYVLFGVADVFTMVGMQEFFYEEAPYGLRSIGLSLYLSVFGIGSFLSSILVAVIDRASKRSDEGKSWFNDNLNAAHMDYFYWLLAVLCALELLLFVLFARSYTYRGRGYNSSSV